ncbi:hypothetical protein [Croceicoccus bisphenolivorans]|uniref:hypothetical protein n=1 Tax=Croceicoccus bisphenolivorans TaxID=1783232 RepID=UPI00082FD242|nr:hypothetical protein [Croceicoccus bisphenolivorans]
MAKHKKPIPHYHQGDLAQRPTSAATYVIGALAIGLVAGVGSIMLGDDPDQAMDKLSAIAATVGEKVQGGSAPAETTGDAD